MTRREWLCMALALLALAVGVLAYALGREAQPRLFPAFLHALVEAPVAVPLAGQLPSLLHTFAFGLAAAAILGPWPRAALGAIAVWTAIELALEAAQSPRLAAALNLAHAKLPKPLRDYLLEGRFDPADLAAAAAGGLLAAAVARTALQIKAEHVQT